MTTSTKLFLSHSSIDKPFARRLAADLRRAGVQVWLDEAEMKIGDSLIESIRKGIDASTYLAVVLSPESVASDWVRREVDVAMNQEILGQRIKVLPLLLKDCELPSFLLGKLYADFRTECDYAIALGKLLTRLGIVVRPMPTEVMAVMQRVRDCCGALGEPVVNVICAIPTHSTRERSWGLESDTILSQLANWRLHLSRHFPDKTLLFTEYGSLGSAVQQLFFADGAVAIVQAVENHGSSNELDLPMFFLNVRENARRFQNFIQYELCQPPFLLAIGIENTVTDRTLWSREGDGQSSVMRFPEIEAAFCKPYGDTGILFPFERDRSVWSEAFAFESREANFSDVVRSALISLWSSATGCSDLLDQLRATETRLAVDAIRSDDWQLSFQFAESVDNLLGLSLRG